MNFEKETSQTSGLDKLIRKINDTGLQTVLVVVVGLNY